MAASLPVRYSPPCLTPCQLIYLYKLVGEQEGGTHLTDMEVELEAAVFILEGFLRSPKQACHSTHLIVQLRVCVASDTCPPAPQPDEKGPFVNRNRAYLWP